MSAEPQPAGNTDLTRRRFLGAAGVAGAAVAAPVLSLAAGACAPQAQLAPAPSGAAPASAPAGQPAWQKQWDDLVAAAKREGKLVILTRPGSGYRKALEAFEQAFPGITVEHTGMVAVQFVPRLLQERQGSVYAVDAFVSTYASPAKTLQDAGGFDPLRPVLFRPDVLDDQAWAGGFDDGWVDTAKQRAYGTIAVRNRWLWVNTNLVQDGEIKSLTDLLNPKWKSRIVSADPRPAGFGYIAGTAMRRVYGDDIIRRLWKDQDVFVSRDYRQMMDGLIKDKYAIAVQAVNDTLLQEYLQQGVGKNLRPLQLEELEHYQIASETAYLINRAPHPNAAKLFLNWVLTKEGQTIWSKNAENNSRRRDVPPNFPELAPPPGKKFVTLDREETLPEIERTQQLATEALG